jgi:ssDNA-binding replication factor A large subunit
MKISELRAGMNEVAVSGKVTEISEPRQVQTKYGLKNVADANVQDDSGSIKLSLWGDQISSVKVGDSVEINGGYIKEWSGELQLGVGRNGELKVV